MQRLLSILPWLVFAFSRCDAANSSQPIVDLGYARHQGFLTTSSYAPSFFNFSNIQYAKAERFGLPATPKDSSIVRTGQQEFICPQASPEWLDTAVEELNGEPVSWPNFTESDIGTVDPRTSEDCLFLDLLVSQDVFENLNGTGAPVVVWIHGGGYVSGYKSIEGDGEGYLARSNGSVIYVGINYRLGLFGWLAGATYSKQAPMNIGLLDQRFALQWIQKNIHLFGGDGSRITVIGESAGAGSIMHQLAAYGGRQGRVPFEKAIIQSPFYQPTGNSAQEQTFQQILKLANVSNFDGLKAVTSAQLQTANALVVGNASPFSTFAFGPVVDGTLVPFDISTLLSHGSFDHSVSIMTGHNLMEGALFTSPFVNSSSSYDAFVKSMFPTMSSSVATYISNTLYPANYNGSYGYTDVQGRLDQTVGDFSIVCYAYSLNSAVSNFTTVNSLVPSTSSSNYAYRFSVPPGIHSADVAYTFWDTGNDVDDDGFPVNTTLATAMQSYFINFASNGDPNRAGLPEWPAYVDAATPTMVDFNTTGIIPIADDTANARCNWWAQGLYLSSENSE